MVSWTALGGLLTAQQEVMLPSFSALKRLHLPPVLCPVLWPPVQERHGQTGKCYQDEKKAGAALLREDEKRSGELGLFMPGKEKTSTNT